MAVKQVIAPDDHPSWAPPRARIDNTIVKALARAFRWRRMLEAGAVVTVREIAAKEKINESHVGRVLRLTLLAPEIVEAILDGRQAPEVTLPELMKAFPVAWAEQGPAPRAMVPGGWANKSKSNLTATLGCVGPPQSALDAPQLPD